MTENTTDNVTQVSNTTSSRGAQWAGAGSLIALAAQSLLGNGNGGGILNGVLGGNNQQNAVFALMNENTKLKADADTDQKLTTVYTTLRQMDKTQDKELADLDKRLSAIETAAPLREQIVLDKINTVASTAQYGISANATAIQNLQNTVNSITKLSIPNSACCPGWGSVTITPVTSGTTIS